MYYRSTCLCLVTHHLPLSHLLFYEIHRYSSSVPQDSSVYLLHSLQELYTKLISGKWQLNMQQIADMRAFLLNENKFYCMYQTERFTMKHRSCFYQKPCLIYVLLKISNTDDTR